MRKFIGILLCLVAPGWILLLFLEQWLLEVGVLNTKDLSPFIGDESGTVWVYLLNIWLWDGVLFLLMVAALPCLILGVWLLWIGRMARG